MTDLFYVAFALLWVVVGFQTLVLVGLLRTVYRPTASAAAPRLPETRLDLTGEPVPEFRAIDIFGKPYTKEMLPSGLSAFLFVSPGCATCMTSLDELSMLREKVNDSVVVVCRGDGNECKRLYENFELGDLPVLFDETHELSKLFGIVGTPTAVLVGGNGRVRSYGHPANKTELTAMIELGEEGKLQRIGAP